MQQTRNATSPPWTAWLVDRWVPALPIVLALGWILFAITALSIGMLVRTSPSGPYEAAEVIEAWRTVRGLPLYEDPQTGHATHFYGPLFPYLVGLVFRLTGPNNVAGRCLNLGSAVLLTVLLARALTRGKSLAHFFTACVLLIAVNHSTHYFHTVNRPEYVAYLFAGVGLVLTYRGWEEERIVPYAFGILSIIVGFLFKQPAAVAVFVPVLVVAADRHRKLRARLLYAALPPAALAATVGTIKALAPTVYYYVIWVPSQYEVNLPAAVVCAWTLLVACPLFLFLFGDWIVNDGARVKDDRRLAWVLSAVVVMLPFSCVAAAKVGGMANSYVPGLLALVAFCVLRLPRLYQKIGDGFLPFGSRLLVGCFGAALFLLTTSPARHLPLHNALRSGSSDFDCAYNEMLRRAAELPGKVACPEDPTIPFYAKGYLGMSVSVELDGHPVDGRAAYSPPEYVYAEIKNADYVVNIKSERWDPRDALTDGELRALGFAPLDEVANQHVPGLYSIWHKP